MSICRWTHKSDVYIYQPDGCGDETYVVQVRDVTATVGSLSIPTLEEMFDSEKQKGIAYTELVKEYLKLKKNVKWIAIRSAYVKEGKITTWSVDSLEDLADLLCSMDEDGVRIPSHVFLKVNTMLDEKMSLNTLENGMRLIEQGFIETPYGTKHYRIVEIMLNNIPHYEWQYHTLPFATLDANGSSGMAKKYGGSIPMQDIVKCYDDLKDHMAYCYDVKRRDLIEARTITHLIDEEIA